MTRMVDSGAGPVPFNPSIHGRTGHPEFHAFGNNRFMQEAYPAICLPRRSECVTFELEIGLSSIEPPLIQKRFPTAAPADQRHGAR